MGIVGKELLKTSFQDKLSKIAAMINQDNNMMHSQN